MIEFKEDFELIKKDNMTLEILEKYPGDDTLLPFYYWGIYVNDIFVGKISLRIGYNFHTYYNGNIGYEIFPEYRGNHYAFIACQLILKVALAHKMKELILTCAEDNISSYKTIEQLGAEFIETADVPKEYFAWHVGIKRERIYKLYLNIGVNKNNRVNTADM